MAFPGGMPNWLCMAHHWPLHRGKRAAPLGRIDGSSADLVPRCACCAARRAGDDWLTEWGEILPTVREAIGDGRPPGHTLWRCRSDDGCGRVVIEWWRLDDEGKRVEAFWFERLREKVRRMNTPVTLACYSGAITEAPCPRPRSACPTN